MDFDNYTESYNELIKKSTGGVIRDPSSIADYKSYVLRKAITKEPETILDLGCGIGNNLNALKRTFNSAEVFGFDISEKSLAVASRLCPDCRFIKQEDLNGFKDSFDVVFVSCVLHHIPKDLRLEFALRSYGLLKPGGVIAIVEHNVYNPLTRAAVSLCPYDKDAVLIRASKVRELLSQAGFIERSSRYILFAPPAWRQLRRIEDIARQLPLGGQHLTLATKPIQ